MKILHLTLKKKWFDMIASGEKKEEYREVKPYWDKRFIQSYCPTHFQSFDLIKFTHGYSKNAPTITVECLGISIGTAKSEWSDNWQGQVFVIKLGEIIKEPTTLKPEFKETIICPECSTKQDAKVEIVNVFGVLMSSYVHTCTNCQYIILESEWTNAESETPNPQAK